MYLSKVHIEVHNNVVLPQAMQSLGESSDHSYNHNPDYFGQYRNHDYSNDYFLGNIMHLFSTSAVITKPERF